MNALKNIIQTTPEFQILSDSEKINIINWIEKLTQDTIQTQETSLENIDTLFD